MAVGGIINETKFSSSTEFSSMYSHWSTGHDLAGNSLNHNQMSHKNLSLPNNGATTNDLFWSTNSPTANNGWGQPKEQNNSNGSTSCWLTTNGGGKNEWPTTFSNNGDGDSTINGTNVWHDLRPTTQQLRYHNSSVWGPPSSHLDDSIKHSTNIYGTTLDDDQDQSFRTPSDRPESEPSDSADIFSPFPG